MPVTKVTIPARRGRAARVSRGAIVKVINTHGQQVIDTWAFNAVNPSEFMSMEHTRAAILKIYPEVGDTLVTNQRRSILTMVEDTSPGLHDTLIAACDRYRYELLGVEGYHDNCADNLTLVMAELHVDLAEIPSPLNLFMNIPVMHGKHLEFLPPVCKPGQYVAFRAEMDLIVAFSACPQDKVPINGISCTPMDAHYTIE